jgi:hypothetical protein
MSQNVSHAQSLSAQGEVPLPEALWCQEIVGSRSFFAMCPAVLNSAGGLPADESAALPDGAENLGPLAVYLPDAYLFTVAAVAAVAAVAESVDTPVLVWPANASIALADVATLERLAESEAGEGLEEAKVVGLHAAEFVVVDFDPREPA